jgi:hypothetical protein
MSFANDSAAYPHESREENQESEVESKPAAVKKPRWYAIQVASGCEKRVKANLEQRIHTKSKARSVARSDSDAAISKSKVKSLP